MIDVCIVFYVKSVVENDLAVRLCGVSTSSKRRYKLRIFQFFFKNFIIFGHTLALNLLTRSQVKVLFSKYATFDH